MKKVNGGTDPDPIGLCAHQINCVNDQGNMF